MPLHVQWNLDSCCCPQALPTNPAGEEHLRDQGRPVLHKHSPPICPSSRADDRKLRVLRQITKGWKGSSQFPLPRNSSRSLPVPPLPLMDVSLRPARSRAALQEASLRIFSSPGRLISLPVCHPGLLLVPPSEGSPQLYTGSLSYPTPCPSWPGFPRQETHVF